MEEMLAQLLEVLRFARRYLLLCLATSMAGCAVAADYFADRGEDLSDVVRAELGWPAFGVHVDATPLVSTGLDVWYAYAPRGGSAGNYRTRLPEQAEFGAYSLIIWHARDLRFNSAELDQNDTQAFQSPYSGFVTHLHEISYAFGDRPVSERLKPVHWLDCEVDAALLLGLRVRISAGEFLDFVLGWFGVDLASDD